MSSIFIPKTMQEAREMRLWEWSRERSREASWAQAPANVYGNGGWRNRRTSQTRNATGVQGRRLRR